MQYDTVPSEILLESFKRLDCEERVRARIVCKEWLKMIDANRSLWRSLDCSIAMDDEAEPKALTLFDEKSQSTLEDVSIYVSEGTTHPREGQNRVLDTLFSTLSKSNKSLQSIKLKAEDSYRVERRMSELLLNCPNLETFVFLEASLSCSVVNLQRKVWDRDATVGNSKLRVLWTRSPRNPSLTHPSLLENLVSLAAEWALSPPEWRELLQSSARSLRHLSLTVNYPRDVKLSIEALNFPNLKVLELNYLKNFPDWLTFPPTTILILRGCLRLSYLPSVYQLWVSAMDDPIIWADFPPLLRELRIQPEKLAQWHRNEVLEFLHERKRMVDVGFELGGVKVIPLKRIVLTFKKTASCKASAFLDEVRDLVEEVVDLAEVPNKIPVDI